MNGIHVIGNIGKDPETRYTSDGKKVFHFTIASNIFRGGQKETVWFNVSCWNERYENVILQLKKGSLIYVSGELSIRKWKDHSGNEQTSLEINAKEVRFVPGRADKPEQGTSSEAQASAFSQEVRPEPYNQPDPFQSASSQNYGQRAPDYQHTTDDIPF